jgi:hypothetical protein
MTMADTVASRAARALDDRLTVLALGAIAASISTVAHEAIGHGGECLAIGGRIIRLTSAFFNCRGGDAFTPIAGPLGNFAAAAIAWMGFAATPSSRIRLKLLFLYVLGFSLFWEAGYMLYAAVKDGGDYVLFLQAIGAPGFSRWLLAVTGLGLYAAGAGLVGRAVLAFGPGAEASTAARARRLLWPAWLGGVLAAATAAAVYAPDRPGALHDGLLEIGGASFPFLLIPLRLWPVARPAAPAPAAARSLAVIATALVVVAALAATLGRGLSF